MDDVKHTEKEPGVPKVTENTQAPFPGKKRGIVETCLWFSMRQQEWKMPPQKHAENAIPKRFNKAESQRTDPTVDIVCV